MDKIELVKIAGIDGVEVEHIIIDRGNNEFTAMSKAEYDRRQAEQSTPIVIDETSTK
jgi:hypothetical protein